MNTHKRIWLAIALLFLDSIVIFLPLTALFAIIILIWRPWWFYDFIDDLYKYKVRQRT